MDSEDDFSRDRTPMPLHPGINYSRVPIGGNVAGLLFVIGSIVVILLGLPELRPFFIWAGTIGVVLGVALILWNRRYR
jgi:hypothetical protein